MLRERDTEAILTAHVSGTVGADIWIEGEGVKLIERSGKGIGQLIIKRRAGVSPPSLVASCGLVVTVYAEDAETTSAHIERDSIHSHSSTCGSIDVLSNNRDLMFRVPVICEVSKSIRVVPEVLSLGRRIASAGSLVRRFVLLVDEPLTVDNLEIQTMQEWVAITVSKVDGEHVGRIAEITCTFELARMPTRIDDDIVRVRDPRSECECVVRAGE